MTKEEIYKQQVARIDAGEMFCLCPSLAPHVGVGFVLARDFPEVHRQRPTGSTEMSGPWFPVNKEGMKKRKIILTHAIYDLQRNNTV